MKCKYCDTEHPKEERGNPHYCIARLNERVEELEAYDCDNNTLAEIIRLKERVEELTEALETPCPWPESVWTMTEDEYVKAIPDERLRTAISGFMARFGWERFRNVAKEALGEKK